MFFQDTCVTTAQLHNNNGPCIFHGGFVESFVDWMMIRKFLYMILIGVIFGCDIHMGQEVRLILEGMFYTFHIRRLVIVHHTFFHNRFDFSQSKII